MARRKNYIFTNKKHSQKAIMSTILGLISLLSLFTVIYLTYLKHGDAPTGYGVTGLLIFLFSAIGLVLGIMTAAEKDRYKLFPFLGILFNALSFIGIGLVIYVGNYR
ncbi:MAG: DUF6142 family protein [Lachnospiraceae bacterium]